MNRIINAIKGTEAMIAAKNLPQSRLDSLNKSLDMELSEYCRFQEIKSLASVNGKLTQDEAMTIYGLLGNTVEHFNSQNVVVKVVLTQVFAELMK